MTGDLDLVSEIWEVVKSSIVVSDRTGVAENIVSVLVDNGYGTDEIKSAFRGDSDIISALKYYVEDEDSVDDDDDFYLDDEDDDDEW